MKHFIILFFALLLAAGCKKNEDVNPDAGARVAGTYTVSRFALTGSGTANTDVTLPRTGTLNGATVTQSGQLILTRLTESSVSMSLVIKTTGQADSNSDFGTVDIRGNDLYDGTNKLGTADGTNVNIDATESGLRLIITAKK